MLFPGSDPFQCGVASLTDLIVHRIAGETNKAALAEWGFLQFMCWMLYTLLYLMMMVRRSSLRFQIHNFPTCQQVMPQDASRV